MTKRNFEKSEANTEKLRPTEKKWKPTRKGAVCVDCKEKKEWEDVVWGKDKKPRCFLCSRDKYGKYMKGFVFCVQCKKLLEAGKDRLCGGWGLGFRSVCIKCRSKKYSFGIDKVLR